MTSTVTKSRRFRTAEESERRVAELIGQGVNQRDASDRALYEELIPALSPEQIAEQLEELRANPKY